MQRLLLLLLAVRLAVAQPQLRGMSSVDLMQPWLKGDFATALRFYNAYEEIGGPFPGHRFRFDMELELAHYKFCSELLGEDGEKSEPGHQMRRARLSYELGEFGEAERTVLQARLQHRARVGLHLLNTLAMIRLERGEYSEAVQLLLSKLKLPRKPNARIDEPEIILALLGAARAQAEMGDFNTAVESGERALDLATRSWGSSSIPALDATQTLASVRIAERKYTDAYSLLAAALQQRIGIYGFMNPKVADSLDAIARVELSLGDFDRALAHADKAMEIRQQIFGGPNYWPARSLLTKGEVYAATGAFDQAARCYDNGVPILESALGVTAPALEKARKRRDAVRARAAVATR